MLKVRKRANYPCFSSSSGFQIFSYSFSRIHLNQNYCYKKISLLVGSVIIGCLCFSPGCFSRQTRPSADDTKAWLSKAREASSESRFLDAAKSYETVLQADYANLKAHRGLVRTYYHLGRTGELESIYRERMEKDPHNPFNFYGLAITIYASSTGRAEEALDFLEKSEKKRPDISDIPYRRGVILLDAELFAEAKEAFMKAMSIEDRARYRAPLALTLHRLGETDRSLEILRDLLALDPDPADVITARKVAEQISDPFLNFPPQARSRLDRAISWLQHADIPQNAIDLLREILLEYPETAMVHAILGLAYQRVDAGGEALTHLREAVGLAPHLATVHLYLANFLYSRERYNDAKESYHTALLQNPLLPEAHKALGQMALDSGDTEEAIFHLRAWSLLSPSSADAGLYLSRALVMKDDYPGAQAVLESIIKKNNNIEALLSLAAIHIRGYKTSQMPDERAMHAQKATEYVETVLEVQPDNQTAIRLSEETKKMMPERRRRR